MFKLFKIISVLYILTCLTVYFIQDKFIFNPEHIPEDYKYRMGKELEIPLENNISLNALLVKQNEESSSKGIIIYLHGNRGSIRFGIYQIRHMLDLGYDILIPDYRSYGKTEGKIESEKQLYADVQKVYDFVRNDYQESDIVIVGYSLGTGPASYLAAKNSPSQLFLIAPFTSLTDIKNKYLWFLPDFLLKYKLPVKSHLQDVTCPVTIIHGTEDEIVDYAFSETLKSKYGNKLELVKATRESHRSIIFAEMLRQTLLQKLAYN